jgi:glutaredoxin-dependent peroxiredoxin
VLAKRLVLMICSTFLIGSSVALPADKLKVGDKAPDFTLPYATKDTIIEALKLSDIVGKDNVVLAFYPADWSGGCTKEMCTMRDNFAALSQLDATIYGLSGDYVYSHREWAKFHNLQFGLLSDHDHAVAKAYDSFNPSSGHDFRTIYVVDKRGRIAYLDLKYSAGSAESFDKLKAALAKLR